VPIRIYALAKELKIDSKDLVDICNKAGITGKGSALASLNDDEADKVKSYLKGPTKKPGPSPPTAAAPGAQPPAEPKAFTRDDYIAPTGNKDKIRVIGGATKPPSEPRKKDEAVKREPKRKSPVINVAPLPEVKQPEPAPPPPEPKAQTPDIRLSKDAMTKKGPLEVAAGVRRRRPPRAVADWLAWPAPVRTAKLVGPAK
jgi:translation initiation factor IF-2